MSPARDHRAPAPHKARKVPWPKITALTDGPALADWTAQAACAGDWDLFDAPDHGLTSRQRADQLAIARAICATCPVAVPCDQYARSARPAVTGIWSGRRRHPSSPTERNRSA